MKNFKNKISIFIIALLVLGSALGLISPKILDSFSNKGTVSENKVVENKNVPNETKKTPKEETSKSNIIDDFQGVADYIHKNNKLPDNFITKAEATKLGWKPGEDLWKYAKNKSIGGDYFGDHEGTLPSKAGRKWTECDINYKGGNRGPHRIVFSNDGLIFGTSDHYKTFKQYY